MAGESEIISKETTSAPRHDTATQSEFAYLQYIMTMTLVKRGDNTRWPQAWNSWEDSTKWAWCWVEQHVSHFLRLPHTDTEV